MPYKTILRKNIAERLKQARENAGYHSAEDFCQKNHLCLDRYLSHENAKLRIETSYAMDYCKLLNISLAWLLVGNLDKIK